MPRGDAGLKRRKISSPLCCANAGGGHEVGQIPCVRLHLRKGLKHIASKFRSPDDFGPTTVARFLASADADERQFQAQDAFGQVERLLRELGMREANPPK